MSGALLAVVVIIVTNLSPVVTRGSEPSPYYRYFERVRPLPAARLGSCDLPEQPQCGLRVDLNQALALEGTHGPGRSQRNFLPRASAFRVSVVFAGMHTEAAGAEAAQSDWVTDPSRPRVPSRFD
jgi:hypothetical protein